MANNLPKPQSIEDTGLKQWLIARSIDYGLFATLVGPDPSNPRVSKRRLAREIQPGRVFAESTITRWLEQMKKEQSNT